MNPQLVAAFVVAATVLIVVPGPNVLFIAGAALGRGRRAGVAAAIGVELATFAHGVIAAVGLAALIAASPLALTVLRFAGAAYLLFLGVRTLLTKPAADVHPTEPEAPDSAAATPGRSPAGRELASGFTVNLLNPKVILFFLAFVPQFLDPAGVLPTWAQVLTLTTVMVVIGLANSAVWVFGIAAAVGTRAGPRTKWMQRYGVGALYIGLAVAAALTNV